MVRTTRAAERGYQRIRRLRHEQRERDQVRFRRPQYGIALHKSCADRVTQLGLFGTSSDNVPDDVDEKIAAGLPPDEARRLALAEFGYIESVRQAVCDHRAGAGVERLAQDVNYGLRQMRPDPGFALAVILTLAFSVGANTAIFSVVNALLLRSLP